ncbi:MAG TPA: RNase H1/viroplasmin domain-containing protein [Methylomirabilota bacterium]|nr:RNase H1/viroplasmin domain-containing protein [Methylomirabilota bacterium]
MKLYVVTASPSLRGIYEPWPPCEAVIAGVGRARYQSVASRDEAEAILRGKSVTLPVGVYAFIDSTEHGGVGVVFVKQRAPTGHDHR